MERKTKPVAVSGGRSEVPLTRLQKLCPKSQTLYLSYLQQEETLSLQQNIMLQLKEVAEAEKAKAERQWLKIRNRNLGNESSTIKSEKSPTLLLAKIKEEIRSLRVKQEESRNSRMKELNEVLVKRNSSPVVLQAAAPRSDKGLKSATLKPDSSPQTEKKVNSDLHEKESKGSKVKEDDGEVHLSQLKNLHSAVGTKLVAFCDLWIALYGVWEEKSNSAPDAILSAIGNAQNWMDQKVMHYDGYEGNAKAAEKSRLKETAVDQSKGFWDMIHCQVDSLAELFLEMKTLGKKKEEKTAQKEHKELTPLGTSQEVYEVHKDGVQSRKHRLEPGKIKSKCASHILKSSLDTQGAEDGPSRVEISDSTKESNHSEAIDVTCFRECHSGACLRLVSLCDTWEKKLTELKLPDFCKEEVLGRIRSAIGGAHLLMRQKLRQFAGLVDMAEDQTGPTKTTAQDLQGFWDMVNCQVSDLLTKFSDLKKLEERDWKTAPPSPMQFEMKKSRAAQRTGRSRKDATREEPANERALEMRKKATQQRAELKKFKLRAASQLKQANEDRGFESEAIDITSFRKCHSDACLKLTTLCDTWEKKMVELEKSEISKEEELGRIRSATGGARLLMRQKLRQFASLVDTAENQTGPTKTTAQDLQGFWDMVYCQVNDLFTKFSELEEMEENGWKIFSSSLTQTKSSSKSRAAQRTGSSRKDAIREPASERALEMRKKATQQRAELKKFKLRAASQLRQANDERNLESEAIDITNFRNCHSDACLKLTTHCDVWEKKVAELELPDDSKEEVLGRIRSATGGARLLMRQKLRQFASLVDTAENQTGPTKTTAQDLQGFWDMVYCQVNDLFTKFSELEEMEENGWKIFSSSLTQTKSSSKSRAAQRTGSSRKDAIREPASERALEMRKKATQQRAELKKFKLRAASQLRQANDERNLESEAIDITNFRNCHSDACLKLTTHCDVWEKKVAELELPDDSKEEVLGRIRSATGGARLLMRQKLRQFASLVDTAENQTGPTKTTAQDLQGFWDMVYCQVNDLFTKFSELEEMEENGWKIFSSSLTQTKSSSKSRAAQRTGSSRKDAIREPASERALEMRKKATQQRAELKKFKLRAASQLRQANDERNLESEAIDITNFRNCHSDACLKLTTHCDVWEKKVAELELPDDSKEEVLGRIRSATGGARLLMRQKLRQFASLVDTAENQTGPTKTTAQDLQGFWDMVYCQVNDLFAKFSELEEMEENGWKIFSSSLTQTKSCKKSRAAQRTGSSRKDAIREPASERVLEMRKKATQQRAELKKFKLRAASQLRQANDERNLESEAIDITSFRNCHSEACLKLTTLCDIWEKKMAELELPDDSKEEVLGRIRSATGGARLLMRQKLSQFAGLVDMAENKTGPTKTTAQDLQGFWDMVFCQVNGMFVKFSELDELEKNHWKVSPLKTKFTDGKLKLQHTTHKPSETCSERVMEIRKKAIERRAEIRRLKAQAVC